MKNRAT